MTVRTGDYVNLAAPLPDFGARLYAGMPDGGVRFLHGGVFDQQCGRSPGTCSTTVQLFPLLSDGYMVLDDVLRDGGTVSGFFTVTFNLGVDFGCGRTAFSSFKAQVQ